MKKTITTAAAAALSMAAPAAADPTIGFGVSFAFGGESSARTALALRLFSDNTRDNFVGSLGVDYLFGSGGFRPTVGAAYLGGNTFVGLDMGLGFGGSEFDFGLSTGLVETNGAATGGGAGAGAGNDSVGGGGNDSVGGGEG